MSGLACTADRIDRKASVAIGRRLPVACRHERLLCVVTSLSRRVAANVSNGRVQRRMRAFISRHVRFSWSWVKSDRLAGALRVHSSWVRSLQRARYRSNSEMHRQIAQRCCIEHADVMDDGEVRTRLVSIPRRIPGPAPPCMRRAQISSSSSRST